ncbi:MAG: hypothetical protein K2K76_08160, partial [Muribaculaceae bacterium]|nr:hypothetical protein [Muribaculaceae bacterium]
MTKLRLWIAGLLLAGAGAGAAAQGAPKTDAAVSDSISGAFATVWADYLKQDMPADPESACKFIEGLTESLNVTPQMEQYYRGVLVGLSVAERVKSMQSMGMPVDGHKTIDVLTALLSGAKSPEMTSEQANEYLNNYVASKMKPEPDTVSVAAEQAFIDGVAKMAGAETLPS